MGDLFYSAVVMSFALRVGARGFRAHTRLLAGRNVVYSSMRPCSFFVSPAGPNLTSKNPHGLYTPRPAVDMVHEEPPTEMTATNVRCDGGGVLGHPVVYISLEKEGQVKQCMYCSARFVRVAGHGHGHGSH